MPHPTSSRRYVLDLVPLIQKLRLLELRNRIYEYAAEDLDDRTYAP